MNRIATGRVAPFVLVATVLLGLVPGSSTLPLIDRDEPRFAQAAVEMIERSDWIVPTFNGADRFDKPPLTYWFIRAGYALAGRGELGARLHSIAATLVLVLATWRFGRRSFGAEPAFLGALGLATCLQVLIHGRLAVADMPMIACVALSMGAIADLLVPAGGAEGGGGDRPSRGAWWVLYVSLGVGFLAKGPIVVAIPALSLILFRWALWRRPIAWSRLRAGRGLLLALAIVAAWGIPAWIATDGRFAAVGLGEHVVERGVAAFNRRSYSPFFYFATAPFSLFPWIGFLPLTWIAARRSWTARNRWLVSWIAALYLIFTPYATQLPHYVLPAFPAVFLLIGQGLCIGDRTRMARWCGGAVAAAAAAIALAAVVVLLTRLWAVDVEPLARSAVAGLVAVFGLSLVPIAALAQRAWIGALGIACIAGGFAGLGASAREAHPVVALSSAFQSAPPGTRCVGYGFSEPSLVFYSGRRWKFCAAESELRAELEKPGPMLVVAPLREARVMAILTGAPQWRGREPPPALASWRHVDAAGINPGRTRWQVLRAWFREE